MRLSYQVTDELYGLLTMAQWELFCSTMTNLTDV